MAGESVDQHETTTTQTSPRHGNNARQESPDMHGNPDGLVSPMRQEVTSGYHGPSSPLSDMANDQWLLSPSDSRFASPDPAGSLTELSVGSYTFRGGPDLLYNDLERCNKALRQLMIKNMVLNYKMKAAQGQEDEEVVRKIEAESLGEIRTIRHHGKKKRTSDCSSSSAIENISVENQSSPMQELVETHLFALSRLADQEMALWPYRSQLAKLGGVIGEMRWLMDRLVLERDEMSQIALLMEEQLETTVMCTEMEHVMLLEEMRKQEEKYERTIKDLRAQLDCTEREARRNKMRADAKIAELNLVIATSNHDIRCLQCENQALWSQLQCETR